MSVSKKVLRRMKKVMGVIGTSVVLVPCSSQISCAKVNVKFDSSTGTLIVSGDGKIGTSWRTKCSENAVKSVIIGGNVKEIGEKAFYCCTSLKEITIPDSVTSIGKEAFCDCAGLETVKFVNSFKKDKVSLRSEDLWSEGCVEVGIKAFAHCKNLKCLDTDGLILKYSGAHEPFYRTPFSCKGEEICEAGIDLIFKGDKSVLSFHNVPFGEDRKDSKCPKCKGYLSERCVIMCGKYSA